MKRHMIKNRRSGVWLTSSQNTGSFPLTQYLGRVAGNFMLIVTAKASMMVLIVTKKMNNAHMFSFRGVLDISAGGRDRAEGEGDGMPAMFNSILPGFACESRK